MRVEEGRIPREAYSCRSQEWGAPGYGDKKRQQWWKQVTPDKYDGASVELQEYLNQFLIVTERNHQDEEEQGLYLAGSLWDVK